MVEHTAEPWTVGKAPYSENLIFGVDRVDGSKQTVAEVLETKAAVVILSEHEVFQGILV